MATTAQRKALDLVIFTVVCVLQPVLFLLSILVPSVLPVSHLALVAVFAPTDLLVLLWLVKSSPSSAGDDREPAQPVAVPARSDGRDLPRLSRRRLVRVTSASGVVPVERALEGLRRVPRFSPRRRDGVLRSGSGPAFVLTRWRITTHDILVPRVRVVLDGSPSGCNATVTVAPVRTRLAVFVAPLPMFLVAVVPTELLDMQQRLIGLGLGLALAVFFAWMAWLDVPQYESDRDEILATLQAILDGVDDPVLLPWL